MLKSKQGVWGWMMMVALATTMTASAQRQMEKLGRGVIVMHSATTQAYLSWRLLANDPAGVGFNVYRIANGGPAVQINLSGPIVNTTDFTDTTANFTISNAWYVTAIIDGVEQTPSAPYGLAANTPVRQYFRIPLQATGGAFPPYDVKFCWVGDFDGDGEYDYLVDRLSTTTGVNQYLQAYKRDGTFLWQVDLGFNSTNTANVYEPDASAISIGDKDNVTVYDLDGDGRAEVILRTANGVILPGGVTVTTNNNTSQFLSVLDGMTGTELARATIPNPYFADGPLNCHAGIVYCDGVHPSIVFDGENRVGSGAFQRLAVAWDYHDRQLFQRWLHIAGPGENDSRAHQIRIADVNHDGKDDLIEIGSVLSGPDGAALYSTELQHGDRYHVTDLDPDRPGLEMYAIQQLNPTLLATALQDLGTGELFKKWYSPGIVDVGRGDALDMDPRYAGTEVFSTQPGIFDCKGNAIPGATAPFPTLGIWWDADNQREMFSAADGNGFNPVINKWNYAANSAGRVYSIYQEGVHTAFGGRPAMFGDLIGDWREEFVVVANDYSEIRIYTTKIAATNRLVCLMQDPAYRVQCTCKGYYQASYPDYFLGEGMQPPPPPPIVDSKLVWRGGASNVWDEAGTANWFTNNLWISNTTAVVYNPGDSVLFDLTGSNNTAITLVGVLMPGDVTVYTPKDYAFAGDGSLSGGMKLVKVGSGALTLSGTNDFTGATTVWEGPLLIDGRLGQSPVTVRGGLWLDGAIAGNGFVGKGATIYRGGSVSPGNGTDAPGILTISNDLVEINGAFNRFDLSDDPGGTTKTNDLLIVIGDVTLTGTNNIVINPLNGSLPPGSVYPLINYSGTLNGSIANLTVSGIPGIPVALTNPPGQIALVVKDHRAPATITWTGGSGGNVWDLLVTSNWLNGVTKDQFAPFDNVRFDNTGLSNTTANLSGNLNAASILVDSTGNYTLAGSGAIIGACSLTKSNTGTLTINASASTFSGRTLIAGGTVVVTELDSVGYPSPLGSPGTGSTNLVLSGNSTLRITGESYTDRGMTLNSGTNSLEVFNGADQVTIAGQIVGSGVLQKLGAGTLALNVSNSFSGGTVIKAGSIALGSVVGNQYGVGSGVVTLDNGTLSMIDIQASESCPWGLRVPTNSTGRLDCDGRCTLTGSLTGGGVFTVFTPYVRTDFSGSWSAFTGQINVITDGDGGNFRCNNSAGYPSAKINLASQVSLQNRVGGTPTISIGELSGAAGCNASAPGGNDGSAVNWRVGGLNTSVTFAGNIVNGVGIIKNGTGTWTLTGTNTYTGQTTVTNGTLQIGNGGTLGTVGAGTITVTGSAILAFNRSDSINDTFNAITGTGNVAKRGAGQLVLTKAHTYSGATMIEAGALVLTNAGSIASSSNIILSSGALLDVSGATNGGMTLASGKKITGFGSVKGNFTVGSGAVLSPGSSIGMLTFSNSLTLTANSSNLFEISSGPATNDVARVLGNLVCGGTLVVTKIGAASLAGGDTFVLFNAASYNGTFAAVFLPALGSGLTWDTTELNTAGKIKVVSPPATPPLIGSAGLFGGNFVFSGTSSVPLGLYHVLASTNLGLPIGQWPSIATNQFGPSGEFSVTNAFDPTAPDQFYLLRLP